MATSYTSLLGLALPVTGELSGTWGDTVNNYITQYVDAAVAGAQTISGTQTAVTLSTTNGGSLTQAGGAGTTGSAQYQIINCTGNPAGALTITAPNTSKVYLVINATSTSQTVTVKASATTGVTVAAARAALIAWNGSDFVLIATNDASKISGILATANGGTGLSSFTANGVVYASSTSALATGSALTFDGSTFSLSGGAITSTDSAGNARSKFEVFTNGQTNNQVTLGQGFAGPTDNVGYLYNRANASFVFGVNNSEQMRLTSTGLGIGTNSPSAKLTTRAIGNSYANSAALSIQNYTGANTTYLTNIGGALYLSMDGSTDNLVMSSSGNLGLGVTPSAWGASWRGLQFGASGAIWSSSSGVAGTYVSNNNYFNGTNRVYLGTGYATEYYQGVGAHIWYNAPSGTAGNAITFTQAMTLDASGQLVIGNTTANAQLEVYKLNASGFSGIRVNNPSGSNLTGVEMGIDWYNATNFQGRISAFRDTNEFRINNPSVGALTLYTNNTERARITSAGEFWVAGTTDQGAYNIQCNGTGVWGAGAYVNGSDRNLKDNIQSLDSGLAVVMAMRPVTFQYKPEHSKDQSVQPGFIAQELQEAMDGKDYLEGVVQSGPNHLNVAYQNIIPILTKAIQELKAEVDSLKAQLSAK